MPAKERSAAERRLAALRAEGAGLRNEASTGAAAAKALHDSIAARGTDVLDASRGLLTQWRAFLALAETEFHRDVANLSLPALFAKWAAIESGLGVAGGGRLGQLAIPSRDRRIVGLSDIERSRLPLGGAILHRGQYLEEIDDRCRVVDWCRFDDDPALVELNRELGALAAAVCNAEKIIARDREQQRQVAETVRFAEQTRRQREAAANRGQGPEYNVPAGYERASHSLAPVVVDPGYRGQDQTLLRGSGQP